MEFAEPILEKEVLEYDFTFTSGIRLPILVDQEAGDSVLEDADSYTLDLVAKPSAVDPEEKLNAEVATVFKSNLAALIVRTRKKRIPTAEEAFAMKKTLHKLAKGVQ